MGTLIENLQKELYNKNIQQWFEYLINESGILSYIMKHDDKAWLMSKLTCLFDYIKESTHRKPDLSLKQLVAQLVFEQRNRHVLKHCMTMTTVTTELYTTITMTHG